MRRAAAVVCALLALGGCRRNASEQIAPGLYAGSTSDDRAVEIDASRPDRIEVNQRKVSYDEPDVNGRFTVTVRRQELRFACVPTERGTELRCQVRFPDRTETIDLLKL